MFKKFFNRTRKEIKPNEQSVNESDNVQTRNSSILVHESRHVTGSDQCKIFRFLHYLVRHFSNNSNCSILLQSFSGAFTKTAKEEFLLFPLLNDDDFEHSNLFEVSFAQGDIAIIQYIDAVKKHLIPHPRTIYEIIIHGTLISERLDNVRHLTLSKENNEKCIIVGDLHGQLDDLLSILDTFGLPGIQTIYVFNGDMIDRGTHSIEVITLVTLLFILHPTSVCLNRGNHEDFLMFMRYGFRDECIRKYKNKGQVIIMAVHNLCASLSLVTVIDGSERVAIMHGGISNGMMLNSIQKIDRRKFTTMLYPPIDQKVKGIEIVTDLTWSDPSAIDCMKPNNARRAGKEFGPSFTDIFVRRNKIDRIIRSHEVVDDGYKYMHSNQVLTIFSASLYMGLYDNFGAVAILSACEPLYIKTYKNEKCHENTFNRLPNDSIATQDVAINVNNRKLNESLKSSAQFLFNSIDQDKSGFIDYLELRKMCKTINPEYTNSDVKGLLKICNFTEKGKIFIGDFEKALAIAIELLP
ncbi:hypothetical protein GJ496_004803 [Pomphorhynchus laevis]|nr:hypothetical protein GJ496_004803 [Pomphorhynchus laevis]